MVAVFLIIPTSIYANTETADIEVILPESRNIDYRDTTFRVYDITEAYNKLIKRKTFEDNKELLVELKREVMETGFKDFKYESIKPERDVARFKIDKNKIYYIYDEKEYIQDFIISYNLEGINDSELTIYAKRGYYEPKRPEKPEKPEEPNEVPNPEPAPTPEPLPTPEPIKTPEPIPTPTPEPAPAPTPTPTPSERVKTGDETKSMAPYLIGGAIIVAGIWIFASKKDKKDKNK